MRRFPSTQLRSLAPIIAVCFSLIVSVAPAAAIIDGQPDTDHPYVGALVAYYPGYGFVPYCSGSLISTTSFVTAAHCVSNLPAGVTLLGVSFDQNPFADPNQVSNLVQIKANGIHVDPAFQPEDIFNDVAVVELAAPVTMSRYGALPQLGALEPFESRKAGDAFFTIVGYGWETYVPHSSGLGTRRVATSRLLGFVYPTSPPARGDSSVSSALKLTNAPATGGGTCFSDSGGPHLVLGGTNVVAAITTGGTKNCTGVHYATRLDTVPVLSFLAPYVK